jgi:hypothetical protein
MRIPLQKLQLLAFSNLVEKPPRLAVIRFRKASLGVTASTAGAHLQRNALPQPFLKFRT